MDPNITGIVQNLVIQQCFLIIFVPVDNITIEANYVVCAAAELFIKQLAKDAYELDNRGILTYKNLATYVQSDEKLDFLHNVVPKKITVREYKKIIAEEKVPNFDSEGSDESSSDESGSEEESDESGESGKEKPTKK